MQDTIEICGCFAVQPIGEFFVGVIQADVLRQIAFADIRRLERESKELEKYSGIQRPLSPQRVKEISNYVKEVDATFPNSLILAISSNDIVAQSGHKLVLNVREDVAKIIDGQHRLAGLQSLISPFDLPVSIFVDLDIEDQASIFSTINSTQTKVTKSLVYDLFELSSRRSPQKTCHDIAKSVNRDPASALYERIKMLGRNPELDGTILYKAPLTQAAFIEGLLPLIIDRKETNQALRGQELAPLSEEEQRHLVFRKYYIADEDWVILRILSNYFTAVRQVFSAEWKDKDNLISRAIGYGALMLLLADLVQVGERNADLQQSFFEALLSRASGKINFSFAPVGKYGASGQGKNDLYNDLKWNILGNE